MNSIIYLEKEIGMKTTELFDLTGTLAEGLLSTCEYPEEALDGLRSFIVKLGKTLDSKTYLRRSEDVWIARGAYVSSSASIAGPCIIGEDAEVRHCAFIRGSVIIGRGSVVGNSTELKNSILFDSVHVPHFNYVGDSILGRGAHFGAGAVTSNVKSDGSDVFVDRSGVRHNSGRRKLGAMVGDGVEIGCGAVLCPGTVIGKNTTVYPLSLVRSTVPADSIYKSKAEIVRKSVR